MKRPYAAPRIVRDEQLTPQQVRGFMEASDMDNEERMRQLSARVAELFGAVPFVLAVHPGPKLPMMTMSPLPEALQLQMLRHLVQSFESNAASPFPGGHLTDVKPGFVTAGDMRAAAVNLRVSATKLASDSGTMKASPGFAQSCASVAGWLDACADTLGGPTDPNNCECGATLANVSVRGVTAQLCPECDRDHLQELQHG